MKAIDYLERIKKLDAEIEENRLEVERLKVMAKKTTASFGDERVQSSGSQQKMADKVVDYSDLEMKIEEDTAKLMECRNEARELVKKACDANCMKLISMRYFGKVIDGKIKYFSWKEISTELNFTEQWVGVGLHKKALKQVQKELDERDGDQDGRNHESNNQT